MSATPVGAHLHDGLLTLIAVQGGHEAGLMAAVWLWVRSERRRFGPAVLVAVIVALAGGAGMAALAGARRAGSALDRLSAAEGLANLQLVPRAEATGGRIDFHRLAESVDLINEAASVPGVEEVTHAGFWGFTTEPEAECQFAVGIVRSTAEHPMGVPVAGRTSGAANAVMITESTSRSFGLEVGSELRLHTVSAMNTTGWLGAAACTAADGPEIPVRVTAIVRNVEDVTDTADPGMTIVVGPGFYDRYVGEVAGCACRVAVRADPDRLDDVGRALEALYAPYGFTVQPVEAFADRAAQTVAIEVDALRVAAVVAAIAGALVVVQVISRQVAAMADGHQVRRALGMTRRQLAGGTALAVFPAIVLGGVVAVTWAALASWFLPRGLAQRAEPDPGISLDAAVLAGGFLATVLIAAAAAWAVGWMLARPSRGDARRPVRSALGPLPFPPHVAFGVRMATNPAGDRSRAAAWSGVLGIALAVTGVLTVWTVVASADHLRHTPTLFGVSADLAVNTEVDDPQAAASPAIEAALADPAIEAVASVLRLSSVDDLVGRGPSGTTARVEPGAIRYERGLIGPTVQQGRLAASGDEVVLGRATAGALGVELGDHLTVTRVDEMPVDYRVVGIAISYGIDVVDEGFELSETGLERLAVPCRAQSANEEGSEGCTDVEIEEVLARTKPGADRRGAAARLSDEGMEPIPPPSIVDRFREIGAVPWYLAAMLVALGAGGLLHSSIVTARRRGHELAITQALGFTPGQAAAAVRWQGLVTAAAGLVVGLVAGVLVGRVVWRNLADTIDVMVAVRLPPWVPLLVIGSTIVVAVATTAWPSARARRARPRELLRAE